MFNQLRSGKHGKATMYINGVELLFVDIFVQSVVYKKGDSLLSPVNNSSS